MIYLTEKIVELHHTGMPVNKIARTLGCSAANVSGTIKRHFGWRGKVAPLAPDQHEWLLREAARNNVEPALMVRALLSDAIEEAMGAEQ